MTSQIVYHNANGATIDMDTNDLTVKYDFGSKNVYPKADKADSVVHDPNRVRRIFTWSCVLSRADMDELDGYVRPAAAPTYDGSYPKIVWTKDEVPTTETVLGMITSVSLGMYSNIADAHYRVTITFTERYDT